MAGTFVNASSQYLAISSSLGAAQNVAGNTVSMWVRPSGVATAYAMVYWTISGANNAARLSLSIQTSPVLYRFTGRRAVAEGSQNINSTTTPASGTLVHLCGVAGWTTQQLRLYVNGVQENSVAPATWTANSENTASQVARIASRGDSTAAGYFQGTLDDVRIYQRVLSAQEVMNLYMARGADSIVNGLYDRWKIIGGTTGSVIGTVPSIGSNQGSAVATNSPTFAESIAKTRTRGYSF